MAHFAQLDENDKVLQVIVVANKDTSDDKGVEKEEIGIAFCKSLFGEDTKWIQTSYNGNFRGNYASIGAQYDKTNDVFYPNPIFSDWVINKTTWQWEAPTPCPNDGKPYDWDETKHAWVESKPVTE